MPIDLSRVFTMPQKREIDRYRAAYQDPDYKMGPDRLRQSQVLIGAAGDAPFLLDVGCGRGEIVAWAKTAGWDAKGTDVVDEIVDANPADLVFAAAWSLPFPDRTADTVCSFDVLEHLLHGDDERAVREMARVTNRRLLITIGLYPSGWQRCGELHINLRPPDEWTLLLAAWLPGFTVTRRADLDVKGINGAWEARRD